MAGHSKFKNIQHRKNAQDKKRAKLFTRLVRDIITAVKEGCSSSIETNTKLRKAVGAAQSFNLPKERITKAIQHGSSHASGEGYMQMRYEGFAQNGVAIIVEALTDNRNRTASEVRSCFSKHGGNLGEMGSVNFMFQHVGMIFYPLSIGQSDDILEKVLECHVDDLAEEDDSHVFYTSIEEFTNAIELLEKKLSQHPADAHLGWRPINLTSLETQEHVDSVFKLIDALENLDDVQQVYTNLDVYSS